MRYLGKKFIFYFVALWAAVTLNFWLPRLMPGNPVLILQAKFKGHLDPAALQAFARAFGLDTHATLIVQYLHYLGQLFTGHLGISFAYFPQSVVSVLAETAPRTLFLVGLSTVVSFGIGTLLGIVSAWRRGSLFDSLSPMITAFLASFPYFWLALLLLYFFAFELGWFPTGGAYSGTDSAWTFSNFGDILYHSILPAITIVITSVGGWLLSMRNNMVSVLNQDFLTVAKAKGLREWRIMLMYSARNAILPNITGFTMALGFVVSGAILTEVVFSYPGLGYTLFQAVQSDDYPLMQGCLLLIAVAVLCANFLTDLLYVWLDPRARSQN